MKSNELSLREKWKHGGGGRIRQPLTLIAIALLVWLCWELRTLIIALIFSLTLASAIAPVAEKCENKWRISRKITVLVIYALIITIYSFLVAALFPTLKEQAVSLYERLPRYAEGLAEIYNHMREMLGENVANFSISTTEVKAFVSRLSGHALHMTSDIVTVAATAILVLFLTAYFVVEAKVMWPQLLAWLPKEKAARAATLIRPLEARLGGYIRGQLLVCLAVSTFLTIGMSLLRVEHALVLGLLSGLLNLVPFVGSMTTALLAILVAFNQSPMLAGAVVLLFVFEQWVESNLIVPNLLGKQVELHPLVVLFAILIFASILGVAGALIAVPVATAGMFLAEEFYLRPMKNREAEEEVRVARAAEAQSEDIDRSYEAAAAILSETASGAHLRLEKERLEQEQKQRATQREQSGENNPQSAEVEPEQSNEV